MIHGRHTHRRCGVYLLPLCVSGFAWSHGVDVRCLLPFISVLINFWEKFSYWAQCSLLHLDLLASNPKAPPISTSPSLSLVFHMEDKVSNSSAHDCEASTSMDEPSGCSLFEDLSLPSWCVFPRVWLLFPGDRGYSVRQSICLWRRWSMGESLIIVLRGYGKLESTCLLVGKTDFLGELSSVTMPHN